MKFHKLYIFVFLLFFSSISIVYSQVGIGTITPDTSSMLDITSTTKGMLAPRMTSAQRTAIASPVEGLLVFDIDEDVFYFYDSSAWLPLESAEKRNNHKLIKSAADLSAELAAGGGTKYLLTSNTLYEINGTIILAQPIDLNNAYLIGLDVNEDILIKSGGTMFTGNTGGSIKTLTLTAPGGTIFGLTGSTGQNLLFRDSIVANAASVGTISGYSLVFSSVIQFAGNTNGITYSNITDLLISNLAWGGSNGGTYVSFVGDFKNIQNQGGYMEVIGATAGIDITGVTSITGGAGLRSIQFLGGGNYINGTAIYPGYNFTNSWDVNCPGIRVETDNNATGDINFNYPVGTGAQTTFSGTGTGSRTKLSGNTTSNNLFRFNSAVNNRITYDGLQTRYFNISTSISFLGTNNNAIFIFYIAKNGVIEDKTRVY